MRIELSHRGDYAVRAMLALARQNSNGPLSARVIAERMEVPVRFLPHVLRDLVAAGLISGQTGRTGGYRLSLPADEINLLLVLDAVEPDHGTPRCVLRGGPCNPDGRCAVHDVFTAATAAMRDCLGGSSLADVARADELLGGEAP